MINISIEDINECQKALDELHLLANKYRLNGHMDEDVMSSYSILQSLLNELKGRCFVTKKINTIIIPFD